MGTSAIHSRPLCGDEDFWRIREFLVGTVPASPVGHNWDVRRWDGKYFYNSGGRWEDGWETHARLWQTPRGRIVGCVNREGAGDAWIQIDPAYRCLEPEMIEWAEQSLAAPVDSGSGRALEFLVFEYDVLRQRTLRDRGYEKMGDGGMLRHMPMPALPQAAVNLPAPYRMRTVNPCDEGDCRQIADLLNAAFHRTFHSAAEFQSFAQLAPCYVQALDLVAVAPDGTFAAYAAMPCDQANRLGIFEPVCTHPAHLRQGLASGLMQAVLHRAQLMDILEVTVETGDMIPANGLYDSLGFTEAYKAFAWRKVLA